MSCDDDDDDVSEEDSEDDDRGCWNKSFCAPPVFCAAKNLQAAIFLEAGHCLILAKNIKIKSLQQVREKPNIAKGTTDPRVEFLLPN